MAAPTILDLPTEVFQNCIFKYLPDIDVYNLRKTGNLRMKQISEDHIELGKYPNIYIYIYIYI